MEVYDTTYAVILDGDSLSVVTLDEETGHVLAVLPLESADVFGDSEY